MMMRHGSLFSGIGGFDLAAEWMGWENVFHCEKDSFCNTVLQYYWPDAESHKDIKNFDATRYKGHIDIVSGGFPCQPFSASGKRRGKADDRYLFPEALRIIKEVRPSWIVLENVAGLFTILEPDSLSEVEHKAVKLFCENREQATDSVIVRIQRRVLGTIISEIGAAGYVFPEMEDGTPVILCIPACAVGAVHRRDRAWLVAYADGVGCAPQHRSEAARQERGKAAGTIGQYPFRDIRPAWPTGSPFCGRDDALSGRLHGISFSRWRTESLKAFGNAIVPGVAYELFRAVEAAGQQEAGNLK